MIVKITRAVLQEANACEEGTEEAMRLATDGVLTIDTDDLLQMIWLRKNDDLAYSWGEVSGVVPFLHLVDKNIVGVDLSGFSANHAALNHVRFTNSTGRHVRFDEASLSNVCFRGCRVRRLSLPYSRTFALDVLSSDLPQWQMYKTANTSSPSLREVSAKESNLADSMWKDAVFNDVDISESDVSDSVFTDCHFSRVNFSKCNLRRTAFTRCIFTNCDFNNAFVSLSLGSPVEGWMVGANGGLHREGAHDDQA